MTKNSQDAEIATLKEAQKNMAEKIDDLKHTVTNGFNEVMDRFDSLDEKYASKLTEKIVYALVGIVLTSVFGALIALVIK